MHVPIAPYLVFRRVYSLSQDLFALTEDLFALMESLFALSEDLFALTGYIRFFRGTLDCLQRSIFIA